MNDLKPYNTDFNLPQTVNFWAEAQRKGYKDLMFYFIKLKYRNNKQPKLSKQELNPFNDTKLNKEFFEQQRAEEKVRGYNRNYDRTGGFIKTSDLNKIGKQIKVPYHTLRTKLRRLVAHGFLIKTHTGYTMISMSKAAEIIGVEVG